MHKTRKESLWTENIVVVIVLCNSLTLIVVMLFPATVLQVFDRRRSKNTLLFHRVVSVSCASQGGHPPCRIDIEAGSLACKQIAMQSSKSNAGSNTTFFYFSFAYLVVNMGRAQQALIYSKDSDMNELTQNIIAYMGITQTQTDSSETCVCGVHIRSTCWFMPVDKSDVLYGIIHGI